MVHYMILPISHEVATGITPTLQTKKPRFKGLACYPGCKSQVLWPQEPRRGWESPRERQGGFVRRGVDTGWKDV